MPRSGVNGTFTLPGAQNTQQPNTTIPSAVNNQGWSDVEQTFNTPQPVFYGGTGATTAVGGADALSTKGTDIASAGTTNLAAATGMFVHITGTTAITAFGTAPAGVRRELVFDGILTLTYNATSLILPGAANITTAAGDTATAISEGSGNWRVTDYQRAATLSGFSSGGNNLIVNGSMAFSQENGNTLGTTNGYYPVDQFALYFTAASAAMSVQRRISRSLSNSIYQIDFKTTAAKASLGSSDYVTITQNIEGSSIAEAGFGTASAIPLVLRMETQLSIGLYHVHFSNAAGTRHCTVPFSVASVSSKQIQNIVVPPDTSGTWLTGDGEIGLTVDLVLAAGSSKTGGSASTWGGTAYLAASTQFNILSSTGNVARLADVGLKLDPDATGVYGAYRVNEVDVVFNAMRYLRPVTTIGAASSATQIASLVNHLGMAKLPTFQAGNGFTVTDGFGGGGTLTQSSYTGTIQPGQSRDTSFVLFGNFAGLTSARMYYTNTNGSVLYANARLS